MWSTLVFTLIFVALGLTVLFVAISGGPGGARKRMASQSRGTRRLALVNFLIALVVLGFAIPAAVIATVNNRDDIPEANVENLTAGEKHGRELFGERCANCHTLQAANAVAQVGPNLDDLLASQTDPAKRKALVLDAIHNGRARGNGNMAADLVEGQDADDVAAFVAKATGGVRQPTRSAQKSSVRAGCHKSVRLQGISALLRCGAASTAEFPEGPGSGGPRQVGRIALRSASPARARQLTP